MRLGNDIMQDWFFTCPFSPFGALLPEAIRDSFSFLSETIRDFGTRLYDWVLKLSYILKFCTLYCAGQIIFRFQCFDALLAETIRDVLLDSVTICWSFLKFWSSVHELDLFCWTLLVIYWFFLCRTIWCSNN